MEEEEPETKIVRAFRSNLNTIREHSFKVQHELLKESIKTNSLYTQILQELRRQNMLLDQARRITVHHD